MKHTSVRPPLGQNLLVSETHADRFAGLLAIRPGDALIEIGVGRGAITRHLLDRGARIWAVEKDVRMVEMFPHEIHALIHDDALRWPEDLPGFLKAEQIRFVVGNLPFYAATPILRRYLPSLHLISKALFSFQKEVADRICAQAGTRNYAALSVLTRIYCTPSMAFTIPPGAFRPAPAVTTGVVLLEPKPSPSIHGVSLERFIFRCFRQPRKTLANNLGREDAERAGIAPGIRPADLSPDEYLDLARRLGVE